MLQTLLPTGEQRILGAAHAAPQPRRHSAPLHSRPQHAHQPIHGARRCVFDALRACSAVAVASSEEQPRDVDLGGSGYSVAWDPLDGSSIVGANWAVRVHVHVLGVFMLVLGSRRSGIRRCKACRREPVSLEAGHVGTCFTACYPCRPLPFLEGGQHLRHLARPRLCGAGCARAGCGRVRRVRAQDAAGAGAACRGRGESARGAGVCAAALWRVAAEQVRPSASRRLRGVPQLQVLAAELVPSRRHA